MNDQAIIYINFVLAAVHGRLAHADHIMHEYGDVVVRVSTLLRERHPIEDLPLYRGILLRPDYDYGVLNPFTSWSESEDVARWFADPDGFLSRPFKQAFPDIKGRLLRTQRPPHVLFHHSWRNVFHRDGCVSLFALSSPDHGEPTRRQIAWSLDTQQEVITTAVTDYESEDCTFTPEDTARRDELLSPPWIDRDAEEEIDMVALFIGSGGYR